MMMVAICAAGLASAGATPTRGPSRIIIATTNESWVILSLPSKTLEHVPFPVGISPVDGSLSPDGSLIAFTAPSEQSQWARLFVYDRAGKSPPKDVSSSPGRYASPSFSRDGQWLYFEHAHGLDGPPGSHSLGAYAQIYRVRPTGSQFEPVTEGRGCHTGPKVAKNKLVYVRHSCSAGAWVELRTVDGQTQRLSPTRESAEDVSISDDGYRLLYSSLELDKTVIRQVDLKTQQTRDIVKIPRLDKPSRPTWASYAEFVYVTGDEFWLYDIKSNRATELKWVK